MLTFEFDGAWYKQQVAFAKASRPPTGRTTKKKKDSERILIGYEDGVLILLFPTFSAAVVSSGSGSGWFSVNPHKLGELLETYRAPARMTVDQGSVQLDKFRAKHDLLLLRLGADDPAFGQEQARIEELAAEQCHAMLIEARENEKQREGQREWRRTNRQMSSSALNELIHEDSLIVYRLPEQPPGSAASKAIVEKKQNVGDQLLLLCSSFSGEKITVDPKWVTSVGC